MASVFISYSRKDIEAAHRLTEALKGQDLDFWIDWEGIEPTVDWWREIEKGIESADNFLFLISPHSINSKVCRQEIDHAFKNGKRLIPVVVQDVRAEDVPGELRLLNWIFLRETDDFEVAFAVLIRAIKTDYDWVQVHRQLQVKALEWERSGQKQDFLLQGEELRDAEIQLVANSSKDPRPTELQRNYVAKSRLRSDRLRRQVVSISIIAAPIMTGLAIFGLVQAQLANTNAAKEQAASTLANANANTAEAAITQAIAQQGTAQAASQLVIAQQATALASAEEAQRQFLIAHSGELASQSLAVQNKDFSLAVLLGVEAFNTYVTAQTRGILMDNTFTSYQELIRRVPFPNELYLGAQIAFSPDRRILATTNKNYILLWDTETGQPIGKPFRGEQGDITDLAFSPSGKLLLSADSYRSTVLFWDVEKRQPVGYPQHTAIGSPSSLAFSPDEKTVAWGSYEEVLLWDLSTGQLIHRWPNEYLGNVSAVFFSPDGKTLTAGGYNGTIAVWDLETGRSINRSAFGLEEYPDCCNATFFSPDGKVGVFEGDNSSLLVQDVESGEIIGQSLEGDTFRYYTDLAFSSDGKMLASLLAASNGSDRTIILWDLATSQPIGQPLTEPEAILGFAFSSNGKELFVVTQTNISYWNVAIWGIGGVRPNTQRIDGQELPQSTSGSSNVLSPDGRIRASSSTAGVIELWDAESAQLLRQLLNGHTGLVTSVSFSPDGKTLASGGEDGLILLWDVESGQRIGQPLDPHQNKVVSVAFSSDGKTLYSIHENDVALVWDVDPLSWIDKACYRAGRNFTRTEWTQYFPFEEYRKTCNRWALEVE